MRKMLTSTQIQQLDSQVKTFSEIQINAANSLNASSSQITDLSLLQNITVNRTLGGNGSLRPHLSNEDLRLIRCQYYDEQPSVGGRSVFLREREMLTPSPGVSPVHTVEDINRSDAISISTGAAGGGSSAQVDSQIHQIGFNSDTARLSDIAPEIFNIEGKKIIVIQRELVSETVSPNLGATLGDFLQNHFTLARLSTSSTSNQVAVDNLISIGNSLQSQQNIEQVTNISLANMQVLQTRSSQVTNFYGVGTNRFEIHLIDLTRTWQDVFQIFSDEVLQFISNLIHSPAVLSDVRLHTIIMVGATSALLPLLLALIPFPYLRFLSIRDLLSSFRQGIRRAATANYHYRLRNDINLIFRSANTTIARLQDQSLNALLLFQSRFNREINNAVTRANSTRAFWRTIIFGGTALGVIFSFLSGKKELLKLLFESKDIIEGGKKLFKIFSSAISASSGLSDSSLQVSNILINFSFWDSVLDAVVHYQSIEMFF